MDFPNPLRTGYRSYSEGESWVHWWLFPRLTDEQTNEFVEGLCGCYNGPGRPYADPGYATHSRSYTLIRQKGGWDV
jgi:hypothetical protein